MRGGNGIEMTIERKVVGGFTRQRSNLEIYLPNLDGIQCHAIVAAEGGG